MTKTVQLSKTARVDESGGLKARSQRLELAQKLNMLKRRLQNNKMKREFLRGSSS